MITNSFITLFRFDDTRGEYFRIGSFPAWVYRQKRTRAISDGTYTRDVFDIRVAQNINGGVQTDDLVCFKKTDSAVPPVDECNRVAAVTENRFGLRPHWHIEAENQYR